MVEHMKHLTIQSKLFISLYSSMIGSLFLMIFEYYKGIVIANKVFLIVIFSVFLLDVVLGILKHIKLRDFSFRDLLTHACLKMFIGFAAMVVFNGFAAILAQDAEFIKTYFVMVGKLLTLVYYAGSAFNSMSVLTNGKFPPVAWMNRMKEFNNTLNPKKLTENEQTN